MTHDYGGRRGVRYLSSFLKVYYIPWVQIFKGTTYPTLLSLLPILRDIWIREDITIVHGHGAFSMTGHEALMQARTMGLRTVFTDHSLFGFADGSSIATNKLLEVFLTDTDHVICVSYTSKENTVLRAGLQPSMVSVIPNAVDASMFTPDVSKRDPRKITIVVISRLVYRKGTGLLAAVIPELCSRHSDLQFVIGGDGDHRILLEEAREKYHLEDRVTMLGAVPHSQVRDVLVKGNIFLNPSLTEAFCIAIVEAACCGLRVVSTRVGGVPEVLPSDMIRLADPSVEALVETLTESIEDCRRGDVIAPDVAHSRVREFYTWQNVARRTELVYDRIVRTPVPTTAERMIKHYQLGPLAGVIYVVVVSIVIMWYHMICWWRPARNIQHVPSACRMWHRRKSSKQ